MIVTEKAGQVRYLLGDGLGSIRQAVDETGAVVAYNTFDPYGNPVQQSTEPYGYTGEWYESYLHLLFLRARWYAPESGTFLSKDAWAGDELRPQSINGWNYVEENPINLIDPSGFCGQDDWFWQRWGGTQSQATKDCIRLAELLEKQYNVVIYWPGRNKMPSGLDNQISCFCSGYEEEFGRGCESDSNITNTGTEYKKWTRNEMIALSIAILMYQKEINYKATRTIMEGMIFVRADASPYGIDRAAGEYWAAGLPGFTGDQPSIVLYDSAHNSDDCCFQFPGGITWTFLHEIAHHVDRLVTDKGLSGNNESFRTEIWSGMATNPGTGPTDYARTSTSVGEDFADTLTTYLWGRQASDWLAPHMVYRFYQMPILSNGRRDDQSLTSERTEFVKNLFDTLKKAF